MAVVVLFHCVVLALTSLSVKAQAPEWAPASSWRFPTGANLYDEIAPTISTNVRQVLDARLPGMVKALHPMYAATPKNEFDRLGHSAVRYCLNRLFVQRHGWFVNGIYAQQGNEQLNETSVGDALLRFVPQAAQKAFEVRLSGVGMDENETALLGGLVEAVIFENEVQELRKAYEWRLFSTTDSLSQKDFDLVVHTHVAFRLSGLPEDVVGKLEFEELEKQTTALYPRWPHTVKFLQDLRSEIAPGKKAFDFATAAEIMREFEGRWARWSANEECSDLKLKLLQIEEGSNTGCVRLSDFYRRSLVSEDGWQFAESPEYLRESGALDESDPENPRIILANYINMPGNCIPTSKFYMSCCISECESLQVRIETALQAPDGFPEEIVRLVEKMPSLSAPDHTVVSASLERRLYEIAKVHSGRVPLQSRAFAQWMHFAYPRECPFPHLTGTTDPSAPDGADLSQVVDQETVQKYASAPPRETPVTQIGTCMHWRHEQELFVPTLHPATTSMAALENDMSLWVSMYMVAALASMSLLSARILQGAWCRRVAKQSELVLV